MRVEPIVWSSKMGNSGRGARGGAAGWGAGWGLGAGGWGLGVPRGAPFFSSEDAPLTETAAPLLSVPPPEAKESQPRLRKDTGKAREVQLGGVFDAWAWQGLGNHGCQ